MEALADRGEEPFGVFVRLHPEVRTPSGFITEAGRSEACRSVLGFPGKFKVFSSALLSVERVQCRSAELGDESGDLCRQLAFDNVSKNWPATARMEVVGSRTRRRYCSSPEKRCFQNAGMPCTSGQRNTRSDIFKLCLGMLLRFRRQIANPESAAFCCYINFMRTFNSEVAARCLAS